MLSWSWQGTPIDVGITSIGTGPRLLLLPALSSISTRHELLPLQQRLAARFSTTAVDWPGFGDLPRPAIAWSPVAYRAFLRFAIESLGRPAATIAAGHAASYVLDLAANSAGVLGPLCLLAPTWRGPLPTMLDGRHRHALARAARLVDYPIIGPLLYRLNVNRFIIRRMTQGHVYADPAWLNPERLAQKEAVTNAPGARHAAFRFVTGELDLYRSRADFLSDADRAGVAVLVLYGAGMPRRSRTEIDALTALPHVTRVMLPKGKLSLYEEFPDEVATVIADFLGREIPG